MNKEQGGSGAVETARNFLKTIKPEKGESVEDYAERLYDWQMEVYSAHAGHDLWMPFANHSKEVHEGWYKVARKAMAEHAQS